jgi:hypothetical protein
VFFYRITRREQIKPDKEQRAFFESTNGGQFIPIVLHKLKEEMETSFDPP